MDRDSTLETHRIPHHKWHKCAAVTDRKWC